MRIDFILIVLVLIVLFWQNTIENRAIEKVEVKVQKSLPMNVSFEQNRAGSYLNRIRESLGMNALDFNPYLERSAQAHADYLVANDASSHYEQEGKLHFTGIKPVDRTLSSGYISRNVSENLSTQTKNAQSSIDGLFSAIYHRFGFLDTSIDELGIGVTQNAKSPQKSAFVYVMGNSEMTRVCGEESFEGTGKYYYKLCKDKEHRISKSVFIDAKSYSQRNNPPIILYPYANQSEVPLAFYVETPDPLPDYDVSGFPVSVEFNTYYFKKPTLLSFRLYDAEDTLIDNVRLMDKESDPHGRFSKHQFALFPLERLEYDSLYRVEVLYIHEGQEASLSWQFSTQTPKETLYVIEKKEETLILSVGQSAILYFKPLHPHDLLGDIRFPADISLERIDNNTFKFTMHKDLGDFEIKSGERILSIKVL